MERQPDLRRLAFALLLAAAALPLSALDSAPANGTCEAIRAWAKENRQNLPKSYRGLLSFPLEQRRAIYADLSPVEKSVFWTEKIAAYLAEHPELEAGQRQAAAEVQAFLTADVHALAAGPDSPAKTSMQNRLLAMAESVTARLGEDHARRLLYGLGPAPADVRRSEPRASERGRCNCWYMFDCTDPEDICDELIGCLQPPFPICGPGAAMPCTGSCVPFG